MKIDQVLNKPNVRLPQDKITHLRKQKKTMMFWLNEYRNFASQI